MYNFYSLSMHSSILDCKLESCDFFIPDMKSRLLMLLPIRDESHCSAICSVGYRNGFKNLLNRKNKINLFINKIRTIYSEGSPECWTLKRKEKVGIK